MNCDLGLCRRRLLSALIVLCSDDEDLNMYPVIPLEMNHFAADSLLYLFTAVSAMLSVVYCLEVNNLMPPLTFTDLSKTGPSGCSASS